MRRGQHVVWYERRDKRGSIIERVGPFPAFSDTAKRAYDLQIHIATIHNHNRHSGDLDRQLVYPIEA